MKTELETRIMELEEAMGRVEIGSSEYECIAKDHATLVKSLNDIRKTDAEIQFKEESLSLEKTKAEDSRIEQEKRTEIEKKSKSLKTKLVEIAAGTWIPVAGYMIWEKTGHIFAGRWEKWVKRPR